MTDAETWQLIDEATGREIEFTNRAEYLATLYSDGYRPVGEQRISSPPSVSAPSPRPTPVETPTRRDSAATPEFRSGE